MSELNPMKKLFLILFILLVAFWVYLEVNAIYLEIKYEKWCQLEGYTYAEAHTPALDHGWQVDCIKEEKFIIWSE